MRPRLRKRVAAATGATALTLGTLTVGPLAGTALAHSPCGAGIYVKGITVEHVAGPDFKIVLEPTTGGRLASAGDLRGSTVEMWHAIQSCVPGLYHGLADSIWQQLECHQMGALAPDGRGGYATGPTYDLETWRIPLGQPSYDAYVRTRCLNTIN